MSVVDRVIEGLARRRGLIADPDRVSAWDGADLDLLQRSGADPLTPERALQYIRLSNAVYSCAHLRARLLSSVPLKAYKFDTGARSVSRPRGRVVDLENPRTRLGMPSMIRGKRLADQGAAVELEQSRIMDLLGYVNRFWTYQRLVVHSQLSLCTGGRSFWTLERGKSQREEPSAIYFVKHTRMTILKHKQEIIAGFRQDAHTRDRQDLAPDNVIWLRYPDPSDPDYGALTPLDAARLGADVYRFALASNKSIFRNGLAPGGWVTPAKDGETWTQEQMDEAEELITRKLSGPQRRHRWLFLREKYGITPNTLTPRDAEFLGGLDFAVEDVARAYGVPIELVGGARRTYQNLENAMKAVWMFTLEPETCFLADELTEQLVPIYDGEVDFLAFDLSDVTALQEDEKERWARSREQIQTGAKVINEWRSEEGLDPVPWGDVAWIPAGLLPVADATNPFAAGDTENAAGETASVGRRLVRGPVPEFGSATHERLWRVAIRRQERHESRVGATVEELLESLQASILDQLRDRDRAAVRAVTLEDLERMFNEKRWRKTFAETIRPLLAAIQADAGDSLFEDLPTVEDKFDPDAPEVLRRLLLQAQSFAREVLSTTWEALKASLVEGIEAGEDIPKLAKRVDTVMGDRIASSKETIARTETAKAWNGGAHEAAKQSGIAETKSWLSALDERVRDTHLAAHGQTVPLDQPFVVGGVEGEFPGEIAAAKESINCRCIATYGFSDSTASARLSESEILEGLSALLASV